MCKEHLVGSKGPSKRRLNTKNKGGGYIIQDSEVCYKEVAHVIMETGQSPDCSQETGNPEEPMFHYKSKGRGKKMKRKTVRPMSQLKPFRQEVFDLICGRVSTLGGFPGGLDSKESACNAGDPSLIPGSGVSPGEEIPWTSEPAGLQSMGSQRVSRE